LVFIDLLLKLWYHFYGLSFLDNVNHKYLFDKD